MKPGFRKTNCRLFIPFVLVAIVATVTSWSLPTLGGQASGPQIRVAVPRTPDSGEPARTPAFTQRPAPAWGKIAFAKGAISWKSKIPPKVGGYVFHAMAGQGAEILVTRPDGRPADAALSLAGSDGTVYQSYDINRPNWRGILPKTENYRIEIAVQGTTNGTELKVTIYPPMRQRKEEFNSRLGFLVSYDASVSHKALPRYFNNELLGILLTDKELYQKTNLQEAYFVISRENLQGRQSCLDAKPYAGEVEKQGTWRVNGIDYRHYHTEEGAAGNLYRTELFRTFVHSFCTTVRLFTHETDIGNYAHGQVKPYDRKRVIKELKQIFFTLRWVKR